MMDTVKTNKVLANMSMLSLQSNGTTLEEIDDQFIADPSALFSKVDKMIALNAAVLKTYKKKIDGTDDENEHPSMLGIVQRNLEKMGLYAEYFNGAIQ